MAPEASIVPDVSPNRETACSVRSSSAGQALICGSRRPVVSAIRGCASCSRAGPTRSRWWHSPPRPRVSSGPCWSKEKFTATAPARRLLPDSGRRPPRSRSCLSEGQLWCDGKWSGNRDRNTPYRHRASQRAAMIGIRSAFSIRARGQRPLLEAVYMTAPRFTCRNTKNALAERGPFIHDGLISLAAFCVRPSGRGIIRLLQHLGDRPQVLPGHPLVGWRAQEVGRMEGGQRADYAGAGIVVEPAPAGLHDALAG